MKSLKKILIENKVFKYLNIEYKSIKLFIAITIFLLMISLLFKSFLLHLDYTLLYNAGDPALNLYFLKWGADFLTGSIQGISIFNLPLAFPFQNSLAFSDNLFGNQIIFLPYYYLTDKPLLSFNLWILTTYFFNYISMYFYLNKSNLLNINNSLIAIIGALIFTFSLPSFDLLGGHLQLLALYFIPITLFLLEKCILEYKTRFFILLGLAISFQFYLGVQTGFILVIILLFMTPVYYIYLLDKKILFLKKVWILGLAFLIPTILLFIPYIQTSKLTGHRTWSEVLNYIPSVINFFSTGIGEKAIFVGWPIFILFVLSIFMAYNNKSKILLSILFFSFLFFLRETGIFHLFFTFIPGFDSIRTPGRFIFVSITLIAIFISYVLSTLPKQLSKNIFIVFFVLLSLSLFKYTIPLQQYQYENKVFSQKLLNKIYNKATLILPLYEFKNPDIFLIIERMKNVNMQFPILDIYSGFNPDFVAEIESQYVNKLHNFSDSKKFIDRIIKLGFVNIVIEKNKMHNQKLLQYIKQSKQFNKKYEDDEILLYSYRRYFNKSSSLNNQLKTSQWKFDIKSYSTKNEQIIFIGNLKGDTLSGVVQKKEEILTNPKIKNKIYPCKLQLNKIKDSYSSFTCITNRQYPELLTENKALNNPKVIYEMIKPFNNETNSIILKVTNSGNEKWFARFNGKFGLALSYKIENRDQNIKTGYDNRFHLPYNVEPGESFQITIPIENLKNGENIITISMVQELVTWFHDKGNKTLSFKVQINREENTNE